MVMGNLFKVLEMGSTEGSTISSLTDCNYIQQSVENTIFVLSFIPFHLDELMSAC
jgi:hypothetical protein